MILTDSMSSDYDGTILETDAKKIFDAGNAIMTTSGTASNEHREELAAALRENQDKSMSEKIEFVSWMNIETQNQHSNLNMNVDIVQFDDNGTQTSLCYVDMKKKILICHLI